MQFLNTPSRVMLFTVLALGYCLGPTSSRSVTSTQTANAQTSSAHAPANPLLSKWEGPYGGVPPFDRVQVSQFKSALEDGMAENLAEVDRIAKDPAAPTFDNTIVAMERGGDTLNRVQTVYGVFGSTMNGPEFQVIQREMAPRLAAFSDQISQNLPLFKRIEAVYNSPDKRKLSPEQQRLAWLYYTRFVRSGARLGSEAKARLSQINQQLAGLYTKFSQNVLAEEDGQFITLKSETELAGLPQSLRDAAAAAAVTKKQPGAWVISNTRSSVDPFLTYSDLRELREKAWRMFINRGDNGDDHDNNASITQILQLRAERAKLLGYQTHAHWRLENAMAKTPENAMQLMEQVWKPAVARVHEEVADMQALADKEGAKIKIEPWDYRYYAEKVRKARYDLDQNEVKQYLQLEKLREGIFWVAGELFNFNFTPAVNVPVVHPDVRVWEVTDKTTKRHIGLWYFDPYARAGKRSGAWMNAYRSQERIAGNITTIVSNNSNFVKGKPGEPLLISWDDATTMFHEFGHALHGLNSNVTYPSLSGTAVARDYVEFPSQLLEHWLSTPEVLQRFAVHSQTGKPIPQNLVERIKRAATFNEGFETVEYLSAALVDMKLHLAGDQTIDADAFEKKTLTELGMPNQIVMRHRTPQFGHVFGSDGYSAGYYSYLWSDVLTADAFGAFVEGGGPYDQKVSERLRKYIFSVGNTIDPAEAYRSFRGRDPQVTWLMKKRGFPATAANQMSSQQEADLSHRAVRTGIQLPSKQGRDDGQTATPLPLIEDSKIKEFDSLPTAAQETTLAAKGPLLPQAYTASNFSMRVFLKGNSPIVIDYAIQPACFAVIGFSVDGVKPFTYSLTSPAMVLDDETARKLSQLPYTPERAEKMLRLLFEDLMRHPEKGRMSQVIQLPPSFGEKPKIGKIWIQAFTNGEGERRPAFFRLYGLGLGNKAVASIQSSTPDNGRMSNHSRYYPFAPGDGNSIAIDRITLSPTTIAAGSGRRVRYGIHSQSAFYNVIAVFNREETVGNISYDSTVFHESLGSVTKNGWLRPRKCICEWDGTGEEGASRGWHYLEVHAFQSTDDRDWVTARSSPRRVLVR